MRLHINKSSPIELVLKPICIDKYLTIETFENKSIKSQTKKSFIMGKQTEYQIPFSKTTEKSSFKMPS